MGQKKTWSEETGLSVHVNQNMLLPHHPAEFSSRPPQKKNRDRHCPNNNLYLYLSFCLWNFNFDLHACKADDLPEVSRNGFNMAIFKAGQHFAWNPMLSGQNWRVVVETIRERHQSSITTKKWHRKYKILSGCRHFPLCFLNYGFSIKLH